ncbi:hypothetical protein TRFO_22928 [Tritrichomonas foetus]|uniref:Uncharacterized protein n=1 Tax=Tritrichomonas foetus TaxID=1144522 RepID=A0A1J4KFU9_9EUKA|nr:hypothetical protein TRFO_22928 [Tritrichomonas foetus]|eukprot:OHT08510.1 hypothetical protein TRFO_22928 [Tritrichomonas foetus]
MIFPLLFISLPVGVPPSLSHKYESAINEIQNTFECFDKSKIIDLSKVNDQYPDCPDASDEPGTGVLYNSTFFCKNTKGTSIEIPSWSVGDGICDCCDGSDELFNSHVKCPDKCDTFESMRADLANQIKKKVIKQYKVSKKWSKRAPMCSKVNQTIQLLKKKIQKIETNPALKKELPLKVSSKIRNKNVFNEVIVAVWEALFMVPRAEWSSQKDRRKIKLDEAKKELTNFENDEKKCENWNDQKRSNKCLFEHFKNSYRLGTYNLEFLEEIKDGRESLGSFTSFENESAYFENGIHGQNTKMNFLCGVTPKWLTMEPKGNGHYLAQFQTPCACTLSYAKYELSMSISELEEIKPRFE